MQATNERELFNSGNVRITDSQFVYGGKPHSLNEIDTVSLIPPIIRRGYGTYIAILGAFIAIAGYFIWNGVLLTPVFAGAVLVVIGVAIMAFARASYVLHLNKRNGEVDKLSVASEAEARQIVDSLNRAIKTQRAS